MTTHELSRHLLDYPDIELKLEVDDAGLIYHEPIERVYLDDSAEYVLISATGGSTGWVYNTPSTGKFD